MEILKIYIQHMTYRPYTQEHSVDTYLLTLTQLICIRSIMCILYYGKT